ncbi:transglycosylase SLT domain-containing protein [Streptomyces sp. NPDC058145]|uniref:transglycosylase SLT domain-containing protein n=1 Tax=Streptomyces sp. NPDC058145 TaxID=3346356 RepID=UPI0036E41F46
MPKNILNRAYSRTLTKQHKIAIAGVGALGAAALAFTAVPGNAQTVTTDAAATQQVHYADTPVKDVKGSLTDRLAGQTAKLDAVAKQQAEAKKQAVAKQQAEAKKKAAAQAAAKKAAQERTDKAASRSAQRPAMQMVAAKTYSNNLDGWIRQSLDIMKSKGIPGSYHGLHKNIIRESSGNPTAINDWDVNAINGIPSKGLLQVIPPTFKAYHVAGTSWNIYDPVANITAAANYAADKYGTIDNVNSAY